MLAQCLMICFFVQLLKLCHSADNSNSAGCLKLLLDQLVPLLVETKEPTVRAMCFAVVCKTLRTIDPIFPHELEMSLWAKSLGKKNTAFFGMVLGLLGKYRHKWLHF